MGIRSKLILIGICFVIIIIVFTLKVANNIQGNPSDTQKETVDENVMTRAEAYRLLSYLYYDKPNRTALPTGIIYANEEMSGWYDSYVNAVWKMGLIEGNITQSPTDALTYGGCKTMIDNLIIKNTEFQRVYQDLSFTFIDAEKAIKAADFLELFEALLDALPEDEQLVSEEILLVLGREPYEEESSKLVTNQGSYDDLNTKNYQRFFSKQDNDSSDYSVIAPDIAKQFLDKGIRVLVCGQELIYIKSETKDKIEIRNVWIKGGEDSTIDTFVNGISKSFTAKYKLSAPISQVIGDITIEDQSIVQISVKPDKINGKVLQTGEDFVEIEGYGRIGLEENYRIYKLYGTLSVEPTNSILVGYDNTNFIVSGGKICAALITESIKADNIRVLLQTSKYQGIYHKKVMLTANESFTVTYNDNTKTTYKPGDKVTIEQGDKRLADGRMIVSTASDQGKIKLLSIERSNGNPKYRGRIEIAQGDQGLLVVNELVLEEYLYAVIPSEMPTSYGEEALKVQAVCARSYAYKHLIANSLNQFGAHVDDSVSYQVYNNIAENEASILAVKDTYGKVIKYDGEVISAYYFSTSCGHTAAAAEAWSSDEDIPYLKGRLLLMNQEGEASAAISDSSKQYNDLSSEKQFRSFIEDNKIITCDASFHWYRWKVTMNIKDIKKVIDAKLADRYQANPELIQLQTNTEAENSLFESLEVDTVGNIEDIQVLRRESSGMVSEILIIGSDHTIKVKNEYNIRTLLAPSYDTITRLDDSEVEGLNLLPSAFFAIDRNEKNNQLKSVTIIGGGYGHGVGLSQNGVQGLAQEGFSYDEITEYFYPGTELGFIYE